MVIMIRLHQKNMFQYLRFLQNTHAHNTGTATYPNQAIRTNPVLLLHRQLGSLHSDRGNRCHNLISHTHSPGRRERPDVRKAKAEIWCSQQAQAERSSGGQGLLHWKLRTSTRNLTKTNKVHPRVSNPEGLCNYWIARSGFVWQS